MDPDAEAERGPIPARNPGPPFAVGQVILCDVPGHLSGLDPTVSVLQQGFIMEAEDPRYKIRLENGATWAQGPGTQFAEDQEDPFADLQGDTSLRLGPYGIHINSQRNSLEKVGKAKAFAKAVKADDAGVQVHLWNDQIRTPLGITQEQQDQALEGF